MRFSLLFLELRGVGSDRITKAGSICCYKLHNIQSHKLHNLKDYTISTTAQKTATIVSIFFTIFLLASHVAPNIIPKYFAIYRS